MPNHIKQFSDNLFSLKGKLQLKKNENELKTFRNIYFKIKSILTFTENITPPLGLNELNRASKSFAFNLSQSMLQTANRRVI